MASVLPSAGCFCGTTVRSTRISAAFIQGRRLEGRDLELEAVPANKHPPNSAGHLVQCTLERFKLLLHSFVVLLKQAWEGSRSEAQGSVKLGLWVINQG